MDQLREREQARSLELQAQGTLIHLWRVAGQQANISVYECDSIDELHAAITSLPLCPRMDVVVTPPATHPNAVGGQQQHPHRAPAA